MIHAGKDVVFEYSADDAAWFPITNIRTGSPSFGRDQEDVTVLGDDAHKVLALLRNSSWSLEWLWESATVQDAIRAACLAGTQIFLRILLDGTTNGYSGPVKVESVDPSFAQDTPVSESVSFAGDGDWVIVS